MKKGKIVFFAFMIISYALLVYGYLTDEVMLYEWSFVALSAFLLIFVILSFAGGNAEKADSKDGSEEETEEDETSSAMAEYEGNIPEIKVSADEAEQYISEIKGLKIAMEDQRDAYETQLSEAEKQLSDAETEVNSLKQKLAELSGLDSEEAIKRAFDRKDSASSSILPEMTGNGSETLDIVGAAKDVAHELQGAATKAGMRIQVSSSEEKILVKADSGLIRVLLRNIVDNSIKYMRRQGTLVITLSTIADDLFVVLKDNGEGLSASETEHIFELNYQGSNRISGNGLGLAQAKAVVEYYGGNIYAKSAPGGGMGIYIQLPTN